MTVDGADRVGTGSRDVGGAVAFTRAEQELLQVATNLVAALPAAPGRRCHELARALGKVLQLPTSDGAVDTVEHSWLWTTNEPQDVRAKILDPQVPGVLPGVQLVDPWSPRGRRYVQGRDRSDLDALEMSGMAAVIAARLVDLQAPRAAADLPRGWRWEVGPGTGARASDGDGWAYVDGDRVVVHVAFALDAGDDLGEVAAQLRSAVLVRHAQRRRHGSRP